MNEGTVIATSGTTFCALLMDMRRHEAKMRPATPLMPGTVVMFTWEGKRAE